MSVIEPTRPTIHSYSKPARVVVGSRPIVLTSGSAAADLHSRHEHHSCLPRITALLTDTNHPYDGAGAEKILRELINPATSLIDDSSLLASILDSINSQTSLLLKKNRLLTTLLGFTDPALHVMLVDSFFRTATAQSFCSRASDFFHALASHSDDSVLTEPILEKILAAILRVHIKTGDKNTLLQTLVPLADPQGLQMIMASFFNLASDTKFNKKTFDTIFQALPGYEDCDVALDDVNFVVSRLEDPQLAIADTKVNYVLNQLVEHASVEACEDSAALAQYIKAENLTRTTRSLKIALAQRQNNTRGLASSVGTGLAGKHDIRRFFDELNTMDKGQAQARLDDISSRLLRDVLPVSLDAEAASNKILKHFFNHLANYAKVNNYDLDDSLLLAATRFNAKSRPACSKPNSYDYCLEFLAAKEPRQDRLQKVLSLMNEPAYAVYLLDNSSRQNQKLWQQLYSKAAQDPTIDTDGIAESIPPSNDKARTLRRNAIILYEFNKALPSFGISDSAYQKAMVRRVDSVLSEYPYPCAKTLDLTPARQQTLPTHLEATNNWLGSHPELLLQA